MPRYIILLNWTDQGVKSIKDSPARLDAARAAGKKAGVTVGDFYLTMGTCDMVAIVDAPDDETAARFNLALAMGGNIRSQTLKAFTEDSYRKILASL